MGCFFNQFEATPLFFSSTLFYFEGARNRWDGAAGRGIRSIRQTRCTGGKRGGHGSLEKNLQGVTACKTGCVEHRLGLRKNAISVWLTYRIKHATRK